MKRRFVLIAIVVAAGLLTGVLLLANRLPDRPSLPFAVTIGSPFKLTAHSGQPFDSRSLAGRPYAIFFGFSHCPDICPTTLIDMTNHLVRLGPLGDRLAVLFVTVDPERDTQQHLARFLSSFDARITGLTGNTQDIRKLAHSFRVSYRKVASPSGYTMDHTASVFLMDGQGRFTGTLDYQEPETAQFEKLRTLVTQ